MDNTKRKKQKKQSQVNSESYKLTANRKQLEVISLDIFSRLQNGQIDWCFSMIPWKHSENLKMVEPLLAQIKKELTGMSNGSLGIGNVSDQARIAYDLHQVIRYVLHRKNLNENHQMIFDEPRQYGNEPLAIIEKKEAYNLTNKKKRRLKDEL